MPKVRKYNDRSEAPKSVIDSRCPRCKHKQCEKCSEIPNLKCASIGFARAGWLLDVPRESLQKGILCCRCGRAACEVQWFAQSWMIEHNPKAYYGDFSKNESATVSTEVNVQQTGKVKKKPHSLSRSKRKHT